MVDISGFAVGDEIGRGGFGVVYRARDLAFGREVAVKVLHDVPGTDLQQRFLTECRAVGSLDGRPGIPTVYSTGVTAEGAPFMAMELLPGGSLSQRQPLPPDVVIAVGRRLAAALQAAHEGGVIHRDVKPANVLFDADDQPVLVDFGISSLVGEATHSGSDNIAVSVAFAPPEVLAGARPEVPGDVYALGATLFCALTNRPPFVSSYGHESLAVVAARIATADVENLRPLGVPDGLARVIEIAMAKDPAARFASMADFGAALAAVAHGQPVAALGPVAAAAAPTRRPPRAALVAAGVAALLLAGVATAVGLTSGGSSGGEPVAATARPGGDRSSTSGRPPTAGASVPPGRGTGVPDAGHGSPAIVAAAPPAPPAPSSGTSTSRPSAPRAGGGRHPHATTTASPRVTAGPAPTPTPTTPPPNHPPTVRATGNTWNEKASVSIPITARDPDGNPVTVTATGLPSWLHLSGSTISGVPPYNAVTLTTTRTAVRVKNFALTVQATDSHGATAQVAVTVRIRDTLRTMPDFIGKTGSGSPSINQVSVPTRSCAYQKSGNGTKIYWQSVRPGTVIAWGRKVTYRYGKNDTGCAHVTGHWPS